MAGRPEVVVKGADQFHHVARQLKELGEGELRKDLTKAIKTATGPAVAESRHVLMSIDSRVVGGGHKRRAEYAAEKNKKRHSTSLRAAISKAITVRQNTSARRAGIRVKVNLDQLPPDQRALPRALDLPKGWRHPVMGNTDHWVTQYGKPWFFSVLVKHAPQVRDEIKRAMDNVASKISARH